MSERTIGTVKEFSTRSGRCTAAAARDAADAAAAVAVLLALAADDPQPVDSGEPGRSFWADPAHHGRELVTGPGRFWASGLPR
ncbi:acyl-CoA carboxylase epsilon subunit [Nakamurella endophytica]|uniref:acyl-CoA carboxylase epsilon subunit n=1 Tax=Nakamurella endophytica TaxID=1748367 RepID=UPI00166941AA|nr:acyl-CoA carboxylase epsilon subunit [Nakamurella endophytica]